MAEFCKQCADDLGFEPDFIGLRSDEEWDKMEEGYGLLVLCEGCGPTVVNRDGECVSLSCPVHGADNADNR